MTKTSDSLLRAVVSMIAVLALIIHVKNPHLLDAVSSGLLVIALLPWLSSIIKTVEVTGLGKLELQVEKVTERQTLLQEEIEGLRFVVSSFVSDWEIIHLTKLASDQPFPYTKGPEKDDHFAQELIRLRDFGLIEKTHTFSLYELPLSGDLKAFIRLTDRGRKYLVVRQKLNAESGTAPLQK